MQTKSLKLILTLTLILIISITTINANEPQSNKAAFFNKKDFLLLEENNTNNINNYIKNEDLDKLLKNKDNYAKTYKFKTTIYWEITEKFNSSFFATPEILALNTVWVKIDISYDGKNKEIKQDKIELYNKNNEKILETEIETMKTIYVFNMKISPFQTACEKLSKILVQEYNKDKKTIFKKMVPEYIETISITEFSNHLEFIFEDEYYKYYTIDDLRYFIHHLEFKNIEIQKNALALKDYKIPIIFAPKTKEGQQLLENRVNEHLKYNKIQNQNLTDKEIWASVLTMHFSEQAQEITIFNEYFLNKNGELLYCIYNDYQGHTFSIKAQEKYKELINKLNQFLFNEVQQFEKIKIKQFEEDDKIKSSLNN